LTLSLDAKPKRLPMQDMTCRTIPGIGKFSLTLSPELGRISPMMQNGSARWIATIVWSSADDRRKWRVAGTAGVLFAGGIAKLVSEFRPPMVFERRDHLGVPNRVLNLVECRGAASSVACYRRGPVGDEQRNRKREAQPSLRGLPHPDDTAGEHLRCAKGRL
jgi:hypothetical protein